MEARVEIASRELVKPSSPTRPQSRDLKLSFIDQLAPSSFISLIFYYQKQPCPKIVDPSKASQHLKQSLSESLTKFHPLAGKLNGNLSIDCDDSGALFVEAKVDAPLSQAFQSTHLEKLNQYLPFHQFAADNDDGKLLATCPRNDILLGIQISWFECGGNAIGVCISHKVADVMSMVTFLNSWAASNRGESTTNPFVLKEPNFDLGRQLFPPPDFHLSFTQPATAERENNIMFKRFLFNKDKLAELKQLATSSSLVKDPTRVELITAFLWKQFIHVSRAKKQDAAGKIFTVNHAVNLRSRMSSLQGSSDDDRFPFGNLAIVTSASFTSEEDQEEKEYGNLVWHTGAAIRKVNEPYVINSVVPFLNSLGSTNGNQVLQQRAMKTDWLFSSWCRFPFYEVDFGWGKPISVCPAAAPAATGGLLMSTRSGDGIEAWIAMTEDEMALFSEEILSLQTTGILAVN